MRAFASFSFYSFCSRTQDFLHLSIVRVKSNRVLSPAKRIPRGP